MLSGEVINKKELLVILSEYYAAGIDSSGTYIRYFDELGIYRINFK
jgi:hypothetical protein